MGSLLSEPSCSRPTPGSVPTPTTQHPDKTLWSLLYRKMWILIETESDIQMLMARDLCHPYIPSTTVLGDRERESVCVC